MSMSCSSACISASKMEMEVHAIAESSHSTDVRRLHSEVRDLSREIPSLPLMCYGHLYKCSYIPTSGPLPYPKETRERREQVRIGQVKTPKWNHLHSPCTWEMGELDTYGSLFIGLLIAASLYGITNIQSAMYFHWYPRDCVRNKLSVCWLWLLDTAHLAFYAHMVYHYLVNDYSDPLARLYTVWSFKAEIVTQAILTISVETLYAIRIFVLAALVDTIETKGPLVRIIMPLLVGVSVLIAYGASAVLSYEIMQFDTWAVTFSARYHWVTYMPLSVAAAVDVVIAASLCYLLSYCRTGYYSMDCSINRLMLYTVNTGMITAICAIISIILTATLPEKFGVPLSVDFVLGKLYVNCFLAMLNARSTLHTGETRETLDPSFTSGLEVSSPRSHPASPSAGERLNLFSVGCILHD